LTQNRTSKKGTYRINGGADTQLRHVT